MKDKIIEGKIKRGFKNMRKALNDMHKAKEKYERLP